MTDDERRALAYAVGSANAALNLSRMLVQMLMQADVIPRSIMLEALDMTSLSVEEGLNDPRAQRDVAAQLEQLRSVLEAMGNLPPMPGHDAG